MTMNGVVDHPLISYLKCGRVSAVATPPVSTIQNASTYCVASPHAWYGRLGTLNRSYFAPLLLVRDRQKRMSKRDSTGAHGSIGWRLSCGMDHNPEPSARQLVACCIATVFTIKYSKPNNLFNNSKMCRKKCIHTSKLSELIPNARVHLKKTQSRATRWK